MKKIKKKKKEEEPGDGYYGTVTTERRPDGVVCRSRSASVSIALIQERTKEGTL